jgi:uncharacterized protein YfaS (alpha-2-macroglobulin family)
MAATVAFIVISSAVYLYYMILEPTPPDLKVLGQKSLLAGSGGALRVRLMDRNSKQGMAGVPVDLELLDENSGQVVHLAHFLTDHQGNARPRFRLPEWEAGNYQLRVAAHTDDGTEVLKRPVRLRRAWKLMLSSDKPVYQPGQTIHLRSLALRRPDLRPVTGQEAVFSVSDPKGNVIFKHRGKASKFGITWADCPLAGEIVEGAYQVTCTLAETESKLTVNVRRYVLPKFKVDVRLDRTYYLPGQTVCGTVQADYFFGQPIVGGTVQVGVKAPPARLGKLKSVKGQTDPQGRATFEIPLPQSVGRDVRLALEVAVTDTAGQKQTRAVAFLVTSRPLRLEVIPEAGRLVRGVPNIVYVFARYADGNPAPRVQLKISGREKRLVTNALGVASFRITPDAEPLELAIEAVDRRQAEASWAGTLNSDSGDLDFLVRTDKSVYDGGDTAHLAAFGRGREPVFVDLIKDGQTILAETIDLKEGRGQYQFDLPPECFGTLQLCAYRLTSDARPVCKTQTLYVRPVRQLRLKAGLDSQRYLPGETARISFAVTDRRGKPVAGALSLAAVDEAVFNVLDHSPGREQTFFALEPALMRPVYGLYPWSSEVRAGRSGRDRIRFEKALFARTATSVGGGGGEAEGEEEKAGGLGGGVSYSLAGSSYPVKEREIEAKKKWVLVGVETAWVVFAGVIATLAYAAFWWFVRPIYVVLAIHVAALLFVCMAMFPTLGGCKKKFKDRARMRETKFEGEEKPSRDAAPKAMGKVPPRKPADDDPGNRKEKRTEGRKARPALRERNWFPETLFWQPQLITNDQGKAVLSLPLADSITTWRLTAGAVSTDGRLGATQAAIEVFKPFFVDLDLPVALTRGDEVALPVVVHNHLKKSQPVRVTLNQAPWFKLLDASPVREFTLGASQVRSIRFRIRVERVGNQVLQVVARGRVDADAIKRSIEVVPDGRRVDRVWSGTLDRPVRVSLKVPPNAIEDSARAFLKIYPSSFSQLVEGLDSIFQMPHGCFEQTSSTTYPNILALAYLKQAKKSVPRVEARARQYIHLGYQRLLAFEVEGGGFSLFGQQPADPVLTAYGLMEFQDMARVHDVDPELIERTRDWLLQQREEDGAWSPEGGGAGRFRRSRGEGMDRLRTTAYVAWAVFADKETRDKAGETTFFLLKHKPDKLDDPYVLALVCNALLAIHPKGSEAGPYLRRLEALKTTAPGGKVFWEQPAEGQTVFHGSGSSGDVETTALAALALITAKQYPATSRKALAWLVSRKDPHGTWYSTQATVLALKALVAGTGKALGGDATRRIVLTWDDGTRRTIRIPADQADVMKQIDLSRYLRPGFRRLRLTEKSRTGAGYQVAFRYHVPAGPPARKEPLSIALAYDRTKLRVRETVQVTATVANRMKQPAAMVMLNLPVPGGFQLVRADLDRRVASGAIAKYEVNARSAVVYLYGLKAGRKFGLKYRLRAGMPVKVAVPAARVYEYYDPDKQGLSPLERKGERVTLVVD